VTDFKGRVTIVNFWATWCTPCIKEIPSLNNLLQSMQGKSFELISVNYAEETQTIKEFMSMVDVEFPVLLDAQGQESAKWKVIAFPSTFVIGRDGLIHYGVNAGIEWDTPEVLRVINQMLEK
jgi:thiol-disulfide isomerase/thioredoxin